MNTLQFIIICVLASTISFVQSAPPTPDACILACAEQVCPGEFASNVTCFCSIGVQAISACITANCTAADLVTEEALQQAACGGAKFSLFRRV